jgi:hypothetical protein
MLKGIICSLVLIAAIFLYKSFIYWLVGISLPAALAVCAAVFAFFILKALEIDRSRIGRQ